MSRNAWEPVAARMADLRALQGAITLLTWDQETYLPKAGAEARGEQLSALQGLYHEKLTAPELGDAILEAESRLLSPALSPAGGEGDEATFRAALRALRFDRDRAVRVPSRLVRELARRQSTALVAWREARDEDRFGRFAPELEQLLALRREQAQAIGAPEGGELYDALLDGYEEGMRVARLEPLFRRLQGWLVPLVERLAAQPPPEDPFTGRRFDLEQQWQLTLEVLAAMGFDLEAGRQDRSIHPFTLGVDPKDVRLTTRLHEDAPLSALFSTLHEGGHGLYEQGLPSAHRRTFLCAAASLGLHESQSRLWENLVGRSRPFWAHLLPRLQARFPALAGVDPDAFHRAVNRVERTLVRTESDEVTYNLHIALRFQLELGMTRGALSVADLPQAWDDGMERLLGVRPRRAAEGVLQDIHWAWGELGYFPTYTIGNLYAASLFAAARAALPALDRDLAAGRLLPLRDWLREHVHRHGRALPAEEVVRRATGRGLQDDDFRAHLEAKYGALYP
jgi:carboxypeptidase Taq